MIKSKAKKSYYNTKVYADGAIGRVLSYSVIENENGIHRKWDFVDADGEVFTATKVVSIEKISFSVRMGVVTAIVQVDGRTYVGNAICSPNETEFSIDFGKKLALARALQDDDTLDYLEWVVSKISK